MIETIEIKKKYLQLINNQKYNPYILCTTSLLFFIPFIYAIEKKLYLYSFFIALMGLLSINHWWKPEYGVNRYIDIVYARCSFMLSLIIFLLINIRINTKGMIDLKQLYFHQIRIHLLYASTTKTIIRAPIISSY